MGELGWNKIFGAILAAVLLIFGLREVSSILFPSGKHHGHHAEDEGKDINEKFAEKYAYTVAVASTGVVGPIEVYDLGKLLANADLSRGERAMTAKCASCHEWNEGGANKTGPALWATVGTGIGEHAPGFGYSAAFRASDASWTYENLDAYLQAPSNFMPGTAMSFVGLKKDQERADVIAYLASITPGAPAFPEPLPEPVAEGDVTDGVSGEGETDPTALTGEIGGTIVEGGTEGETTETELVPADTPAPTEPETTEE